MLGFNAMTVLLNKNPAAIAIVLLIMFFTMTSTSVFTLKQFTELSVDFEDQKYETAARVIARGFSEVNTNSVDRTKFWIAERWDVQLGYLDMLCDQPERKRLYSMVSTATGIEICRIVG